MRLGFGISPLLCKTIVDNMNLLIPNLNVQSLHVRQALYWISHKLSCKKLCKCYSCHQSSTTKNHIIELCTKEDLDQSRWLWCYLSFLAAPIWFWSGRTRLLQHSSSSNLIVSETGRPNHWKDKLRKIWTLITWFAFLPSPISRFSGLMSRCRKPFEWIYCNPVICDI